MQSFGQVCGKCAQVLPVRFKLQLRKYFDRCYERNVHILNQIQPSDKVLDIGCVGHEIEERDLSDPPRGYFLHHDLHQHADQVVGIDILDTEVEKMVAAGYDVKVADAQRFDLNETFDVIVAGELIEHLENPGLFLQCCRSHLKKDGKVIISTPNPQHIQFVLYRLIGETVNDEHTLWLDHDVMETLAEREGLALTEYKYFSPNITIMSMPMYKLGIAKPITSGGYIFELKVAQEINQ